MRRVGALCSALILVFLVAPPAAAVEPPVIDPSTLPPDETGPDQPMVQRRVCAAPTTFPNSNFADEPWANAYLRLAEAQKFATGAGVTVAVIDTGVNGSPRVPAEPGGDFVDGAADGMSDCDAHGTLTTAVLAGRPAPTDAFIGVAPDARILSLRQTSDSFLPVGARTDPNDPHATRTAGSLRSLARAIVHAANMGAQVINISEAACYKVSRPMDEYAEDTVGAAIDYAVNVKGAVLVVAAGNSGGDCAPNPPPDAAAPADPRGWQQVQTIVSPAWYSPMVLTVGSIARDGQPSGFSMQGPWVDAAAPGEDLTSVGYDGNPVNALHGDDGPIPISGTSFSAAYVSGLAALLKQRFPDLTPAQLINRIIATARHPGGGADNAVGAGVVDPVAALTWDVPAGPATIPYAVKQVTPPEQLPPADRAPITGVVIVGVGVAALLGIAVLSRRALTRTGPKSR